MNAYKHSQSEAVILDRAKDSKKDQDRDEPLKTLKFHQYILHRSLSSQIVQQALRKTPQALKSVGNGMAYEVM